MESASKPLVNIGALFLIGVILAFNSKEIRSEIPVEKRQDEIVARDAEYILHLNEQAKELINAGRLDSARILIEEGLLLAGQLNDTEGAAYAAKNLGNYFMERGMPDSLVYSVEGMFPAFADTENEIQIGNLLGNAHNMLGNYHQGLEYYNRMLELANARNETRMMIGITQNLGNNYQSLGDVPAAIDSYMSSLEMAEETQDTLIIAVVLDNLASVNSNEGNYELAEQYLTKALTYNLQMNNIGNQITNHTSMGSLYRNMGKHEEARQHFDRVIELADSVGNKLTNMQALHNLGQLFGEMEEYDQAMSMFRQSLDLSRQSNIHIGVYYNQNGIASVYAETGEFQRAAGLFESSLEMAEMAGGEDMIKSTVQNLYQVYENLGDTATAYHYLKRHAALTDSLSKTQREESLARQEVVLGLRAERERNALLEETILTQRTNSIIITTLLGVIFIALFATIILYRKKQKANTLLQSRTGELSDVNEMKDQLLSVLSHDLRTPINNIKGVVYMIREKLLDKGDIENALTNIELQLEQDVNTLTNYLEWAQNQRDGIKADLKPYSAKELADTAIDKIKQSAEKKGVYIQNRVQGNTTVFADKQMMAVIFRNLLSNAVKYIEAGDKITLSLKKQNGKALLTIQDTGQGIPYELQANLFEAFSKRRMESNGEIGTGLGLSICKDFAGQMGGDLTFESTPGAGTSFTLILHEAPAGIGVSTTATAGA